MFLGASSFIYEKAHELRLRETEAEKLLWSKLCKKQLGVKFRRQHPMYNYIVDFYCHSHKLVIEVDGPIHDTEESKAYDKTRSQAFEEFEIDTIRFTNEEVFNDLAGVIQRIRNRLERKSLN